MIGIEPLPPTTNRHFLVTDAFGTRVILRHYLRTPTRRHAPLSRLKRERWTLETLAAAGAPVPRVFAASETRDAEAILIEFAEGALLGSLVRRLRSDEAESAWSAAGHALAAVHAVNGQAAQAAGCERAGIRAPQASRGPYHYDEARANLERLAGSRPDLPVRALAELVEQARPQYERAPLGLCQYDAHLWQFVLARRGSKWECTAILDWENADLDDPDWDVAQMDGFRFEAVGPTPPTFFAAYGRQPGALYPLYRIERAVWILDAFARGENWLTRSAPPAEAYLEDVLAELG